MLLEAVANTFTGLRSIGGTVTVTDRRLLFTPNRLDGWTGGRRIAIARVDITRVWTEAPGGAAVLRRGAGAALRPQVGIEHPAGSTFFTVSQPEELLQALRSSGE